MVRGSCWSCSLVRNSVFLLSSAKQCRQVCWLGRSHLRNVVHVVMQAS